MPGRHASRSTRPGAPWPRTSGTSRCSGQPCRCPWRSPAAEGEKSRRMISGTAMLPTVMARPISTVPATTRAGPPADRTSTPARTPRMVRLTANSAPNFLAARDASGEASEKQSTGMLVSSPSTTGEKCSSACIRSTTGATATNGPRRFSASRPMQASRIQLAGIRRKQPAGHAGGQAGTRKSLITLIAITPRRPTACKVAA